LGLGLLGFVEPCTVGGHLIFLRSMADKSLRTRTGAALAFTLVRTLMMGAFGAVVVVLGKSLIDVQTALWLIFGSLYILIGIAYGVGRAGVFERHVDFVPSAWKAAENPFVLGAALGLNIPACAAPILFGLIGLAASSGAVTLGIATMAVFGLALSAPLVVLAASPASASLADRLMGVRPRTRWVLAAVFVALGAWSIWFGLFVDPADWATL
jgi:cytochrome c-type biogenesis protein